MYKNKSFFTTWVVELKTLDQKPNTLAMSYIPFCCTVGRKLKGVCVVISLGARGPL